jgi:CheY-like chemotaxis protein
MKVIYVEDNENNQRLMERFLSKYGMTIKCYPTAEEGFEAILEQQPELIFVDVHLKTRATGLDLVGWLRERGITTPIIVVTCFNMLADRRRALDAGCNGYLSKPYTMQELYDVVEKLAPAMTA